MLVDKQIKGYGEKLIKPFNDDQVGCVSYDIKIKGYVDSVGFTQEKQFTIKPNETIIVQAKESLSMPDNLVAIIGEKNSRIRQGLVVSGPRFFPGHKTSVFIRITNISTNEIILEPGDEIAQLFFEELSMTPEKTYDHIPSASYNGEINYLGYGKYTDAYESKMKKIQSSEEKLQNTENSIYSNILTLMGIFVSIFSLIIVNITSIGNLTTRELLKVNLSLGFVITILLGTVLLFLNRNQEKEGQKLYFRIMIALCIAMVILTLKL